MALSVMVMFSGQTFVQHLVMLQKPMPCALPQFRQAVFGVQRVHLQRGGINQKARADEFFVLVMVAQYMADILAEKTFDALAEFLHAVNVLLRHAPGAVRRVRLARIEFLDLLFDPEIPRNIRRQIADARKCRASARS